MEVRFIIKSENIVFSYNTVYLPRFVAILLVAIQTDLT